MITKIENVDVLYKNRTKNINFDNLIVKCNQMS